MKRESPDWIKTSGRKNLTTHCERCGDSFVVRLPVRLSGFCGLVKAFIKVHRKCQAKEVS